MSRSQLRAVDDANEDDGRRDLTVEQLASATGMSVRNIRNHQSRVMRMADVLGRSFGSTIDTKPAEKMPKSPSRMK